MHVLFQDVSTALRALRSAPLTTAAAILVIALGLGVNLAVFAVTRGILLKPFPYADASQLVVFSVSTSDGNDFGLRFNRLQEWEEHLRTVESLAGYSTTEEAWREAGEPRIVRTAHVTENFFAVLGVDPVRGHLNTFGESSQFAVLAARLASQLENSADLDPLRVQATLGERPITPLAVMPPDFTFPNDSIDAWLPAQNVPAGQPDTRSVRVVARLRPGATAAHMRQEAADAILKIHGPNSTSEPTVVPLKEALVGALRPVLGASTAAALLVLLVTCGNVAMLLVGQAALRRRETAVRLALGAGRLRLFRASLVEGLLLASGGALLGLWLAKAALGVFAHTAAGVLPRWQAIEFDPVVLLIGVALVFFVTLLCGVAPALEAPFRNMSPSLRGSASEHPRTRRLLGAVVIAQIAASVVLLTSAALLARTVTHLLDDVVGVEPSQVLALPLNLEPEAGTRNIHHPRFVEEVLDRVHALPGVERAGIGSGLPPVGRPFQIFVRFLSETRDEGRSMSTVWATPGFLEALGTPLLEGRGLEEADGSRPVVILSASAARLYAPNRSLVGRDLPRRLPPIAPPEPHRVIGLVPDMHYTGLDQPPAGALYLPWREHPLGVTYLVMRTSGDPLALAPAVRRILQEADPALPIPPIRSLEDLRSRSIADRRLRVLPALGFAAVAFAVALTGLFALLARAAAERRREFALRIALGASRSHVLGRILVRALALTGAGIAVGLLGTFAVATGLRSLLFGVGPQDPPTLAAVTLVVGVAALLAAWLPAWRAAQVVPWKLLRTE